MWECVLCIWGLWLTACEREILTSSPMPALDTQLGRFSWAVLGSKVRGQGDHKRGTRVPPSSWGATDWLVSTTGNPPGPCGQDGSMLRSHSLYLILRGASYPSTSQGETEALTCAKWQQSSYSNPGLPALGTCSGPSHLELDSSSPSSLPFPDPDESSGVVGGLQCELE